LNLFATISSFLGLQIIACNLLRLVKWIFSRPSVLYCTSCLFKSWFLTMTSDTILLSYASCHQSYGIDLTFINPVLFLES